MAEERGNSLKVVAGFFSEKSGCVTEVDGFGRKVLFPARYLEVRLNAKPVHKAAVKRSMKRNVMGHAGPLLNNSSPSLALRAVPFWIYP